MKLSIRRNKKCFPHGFTFKHYKNIIQIDISLKQSSGYIEPKKIWGWFEFRILGYGIDFDYNIHTSGFRFYSFKWQRPAFESVILKAIMKYKRNDNLTSKSNK